MFDITWFGIRVMMQHCHGDHQAVAQWRQQHCRVNTETMSLTAQLVGLSGVIDTSCVVDTVTIIGTVES